MTGQGRATWGPGRGARGGGWEEGEERGREGELTSGLDDWRQPLTGIPPSARGGGREVEERKREVVAWEKKMREGVGARMGGGR
jgi:hypothetical protein